MSDRITIRLTEAEFRRECEQAAAAKGVPIGVWFRSLAEKSLRRKYKIVPGMLAVPEAKRSKMNRAAATVRWGEFVCVECRRIFQRGDKQPGGSVCRSCFSAKTCGKGATDGTDD